MLTILVIIIFYYFFFSANNLTAAHAKTAEDNATKILTLRTTVKQNILKKIDTPRTRGAKILEVDP